jgi:replicative DNA helicase
MDNDNIKNIYNIEAENALLGALLINNNLFEHVSSIITFEHFYSPINRDVFFIYKKIADKGLIADPISILHSLKNLDVANKDSINQEYLANLIDSSLNSSYESAKTYANIIYDCFLKRELLGMVNNLQESIKNQDLTALEQIEDLEKSIFTLAEKGATKYEFKDFSTSISIAIELAKKARLNTDGISGVTTGFLDVDKKLGGMQLSDLIVLAGRPSMGKTALATNIAYNAAFKYRETKGKKGAVVGVFSLEMSAEQLAGRILSTQANIRSDMIKKGMMQDSDFNRLIACSEDLKSVPIFIDDTPSITVSQIRAKARRLKRKNNLGLIVIDYIQLIGSDRRSFDGNRSVEVSEITRGLKGIAKELNLPVIALSQLSRAVDAREDKRPLLSDLRESGSIEQDADVVSFIFREEYYLDRAKPDEGSNKFLEWNQKKQSAKDKATVVIAKNRHGPIGDIDLRFNAMYTQFENLDTKTDVK